MTSCVDSILILLLQIIATNIGIELDVWYNVTIRGLAEGRSNYTLEVNGYRATTIDEDFTEFNLSSLNGMLYIGGHPDPMEIEVSKETDLYHDKI